MIGFQVQNQYKKHKTVNIKRTETHGAPPSFFRARVCGLIVSVPAYGAGNGLHFVRQRLRRQHFHRPAE